MPEFRAHSSELTPEIINKTKRGRVAKKLERNSKHSKVKGTY